MRLRFDEQGVHGVPEEPGVYFLWSQQDLVYIGRTAPRTNLRHELSHALTMVQAADMLVTDFSFEVTKSPRTRAAEELRSYFEDWGRLPAYNSAAPANTSDFKSKAL